MPSQHQPHYINEISIRFNFDELHTFFCHQNVDSSPMLLGMDHKMNLHTCLQHSRDQHVKTAKKTELYQSTTAIQLTEIFCDT